MAAWKSCWTTLRIIGLLLVVSLLGIARTATAVDFQAGNIAGTVAWNGAPLKFPVFVYAQDPAGNFAAGSYLNYDGTYAMAGLAPNTYTISVSQHGCTGEASLLGQVTAVATAGQTTLTNIDVTASAGQVTGIVTLNGVPLSGAYFIAEGLCGSWGTAGDGTFVHHLKPGIYTARVYTSASTLLGSVVFTVAAGITTTIETAAFQAGNIAGTVAWNGAPLKFPVFVYAQDPAGNFAAGSYLNYDGTYAMAGLAPNTYTISVSQHGCTGEASLLGQVTAVATAGQTTLTNIDVTASAGQVTGIVTLNGVPLSGAYFIAEGLCGSWGTAGDGTFVHHLKPGIYTARVYTSASTLLGSVVFTVAAGITTTIETAAFQAGNIAGTVAWNGAPLKFPVFVYAQDPAGNFAAGSYLNYDGTYAMAGLAPNTYTISVSQHGCTGEASLLGQVTAVATAGQTTLTNIDVTASAGQVTGIVTLNGVPLSGAYFIAEGLCGSWGTAGDGTFVHHLKPGIYTARVYTSASTLLGSIGFTILAGKVADLDSVYGATPSGTNVTVSVDTPTTPVDITFASVVSSGTTSVTSSESGPPPHEGFKLGNPPVFYDVSTTASFTGTVTLCFAWSPGQFNNPQQVRLMHYESNAWHDVTSSVNWTARIVCGTVTSLSPFAIVEPASATYPFSGFYRPITNLPAVNTVKAGSAVPVKFSLGGDRGLGIFAAGYPKAQTVSCSSGSGTDVITETVTAGSSGLSYDAAAGQYNYVWKTLKEWAGTCKQLILLFNDGGNPQSAAFQLTK